MPVRVLQAVRVHPTDDMLEEYLFGHIREPACHALEEHVLYCHQCQDVLDSASQFGSWLKPELAAFEARHRRPIYWQRWLTWIIIRPAAPRWPQQKRKILRWPGTRRLFLVAAGVALVACVALIVTRKPPPGPPATVVLSAFRGAASDGVSLAPAETPLDLTIDTTRLPRAGTSYLLQIVDASGKEVWRSALSEEKVTQLKAHVSKGFNPGVYWVRLYHASPSPPELVREFGLRIE